MNILYVCRGNTCRSPLAEAIACHEALRRGLEIDVHSAGTHAHEGKQAEEKAQSVAREHGLDLSQHRARQLGHEIVTEADKVFVMEACQLDDRRLVGSDRALVTAYENPPGRDVDDPYSMGIEDYRTCYAELSVAVRSLFDELEGGQADAPIE